EDEVQVISIGGQIEPEPAPKPSGPPQLRKGTQVSVRIAQALSSGINQKGDKILIRAAKKVGGGRQGLIPEGAPGWAVVEKVEESNSGGLLTLRLKSIEDVYGNSHPLQGLIEIKGKEEQALVAVGQVYQGKLAKTAKIVYRKNKSSKQDKVFGTVKFEDRRLELRLDRKSYKNTKAKVEAILEIAPPFIIDDLVPETVALVEVNGKRLPKAVLANARNPRKGDYNKNNISDLKVYFNLYDLAKYLKKGSNKLVLEGRFQKTRLFVASTMIEADY
ncbi:MAG: hypothetical protein KDK66_09605, partial [Deltaproteobacteria bacterium]|nr:hypothetical protein [Deltaproteobacteria bacterium]